MCMLPNNSGLLLRSPIFGHDLLALVKMSQSHSHDYLEQILPDQYIKIRVLDDYVNTQKDEFGRDWSRQVYTF